MFPQMENLCRVQDPHATDTCHWINKSTQLMKITTREQIVHVSSNMGAFNI